MVRGIVLAALIATFAGGAAFAQETCDSKAVGKDGKPLAGAAKTSFLKKCLADSCAGKAVSADGKPLSGAAKTSFITKCEKGCWSGSLPPRRKDRGIALHDYSIAVALVGGGVLVSPSGQGCSCAAPGYGPAPRLRAASKRHQSVP
jgi:hypothetical protein